MPVTIKYSLSFLLNWLPTRKLCSLQSTSAWSLCQLTICLILSEFEYLCHQKLSPSAPLSPRKWLLNWLPQNSCWNLWHVFPSLLVYFFYLFFFTLDLKECFLFPLHLFLIWLGRLRCIKYIMRLCLVVTKCRVIQTCKL